MDLSKEVRYLKMLFLQGVLISAGCPFNFGGSQRIRFNPAAGYREIARLQVKPQTRQVYYFKK